MSPSENEKDQINNYSSTSSFDSSNSFYSTDSSNSQSNSKVNHVRVDKAGMFDPRWQGLVDQKIRTFLQELKRPDAFSPLLDLETVKLESSTDPATPFCFRTTAQFIGQSAAKAFALFASVTERPQWDSLCESIRILRQIDALTFIYHLKLKATWPTSPRDSLLIAAFRRLTDGRFVSVAWSIEDDSLCPPDPTGYFIRMNTRISANLITPLGPSAFTLNQLIDAEPKGSIPAYLIKKVSAKSLPATIQSIKTAIHQSPLSEKAAESFYDDILFQNSTDFDSGDTDDNEIEIEIDNETEIEIKAINEDENLSVNLIKNIKKRIDVLEASLKQHENGQKIWNYSVITISSISLLLLLRLNLRKSK